MQNRAIPRNIGFGGRAREEDGRRRVEAADRRRTGVDLARAEIGRLLPRNWNALAVRTPFFPILSDKLSVLPADSLRLDALSKRFRPLPPHRCINEQIYPL